jgi:hypothetical protein
MMRRPRGKEDRYIKRIMLLTLLAFAVIGGSAAQVKAADCSVNVNACISGNQDKPNAVAKCQAAAQRCAKTGVYVGPFNGQTYQAGKCGRWGCGA